MTRARSARVGSAIGIAIVALTLLFTSQDLMRRGLVGGGLRAGLAPALAVNALDWVTWGALAPCILLVTEHRRLDDAPRRAANALVWIAFGIVCCLTHSLITGIVVRTWSLVPAPRAAAAQPTWRFLLGWTASTTGFNVIIFIMIAGLLHAMFYYEDLRERSVREASLETRLARAELNVLRMQLNPHFLFNTLHAVSSLMVSDVPTAQRVLSALGDLLRTSIDHTARQEVTLRSELGFLARYLDIQRARFRNRLAVDIDVAPTILGALVPSLVLQPLVENAIYHAIDPSPAGGTVTVRGTREGGRLTLVVSDDGAAMQHAAGSERRGGVGLANIEARLTQLYGQDQIFRAERRPSGGFEVRMSLPLRFATAEADAPLESTTST